MEQSYLDGNPHKDNLHRGKYIITYSGTRFYPFDPRPEEIHIEDIAHALACQSRFTGHTREPYPVAQHSVLVAELVEEWTEDYEKVMAALLHDATETYLVDLPRPLKASVQLGNAFRAVEDKLAHAIAEKFDLVYPFPDEVKKADEILLVTEQRDLMNIPSDESMWLEGVEPLRHPIGSWQWDEAEQEFMDAFQLYQQLRKSAS